MKNYMLALLVISAASVCAFAQDLDAPVSGAHTDDSDDAGTNHSAVFELIVSKLLEMESRYIARQVSEWEWIKWGYWHGAGTSADRGGSDYGWASNQAIHYELWDVLSPAEFAEAWRQFVECWDRILTAGLN